MHELSYSLRYPLCVEDDEKDESRKNEYLSVEGKQKQLRPLGGGGLSNEQNLDHFRSILFRCCEAVDSHQ